MRALFPGERLTLQSSDDALPDILARALLPDVTIVDGCAVLGEVNSAPSLASVIAHVNDQTGYESFVNHFHFRQADSAVALRQAVTFCEQTVSQLRCVAPDRTFRFVVSSNGDDWTVRFHTLRPGESWVSDNLEGYLKEAVMVFDSTEFSSVGK